MQRVQSHIDGDLLYRKLAPSVSFLRDTTPVPPFSVRVLWCYVTYFDAGINCEMSHRFQIASKDVEPIAHYCNHRGIPCDTSSQSTIDTLRMAALIHDMVRADMADGTQLPEVTIFDGYINIRYDAPRGGKTVIRNIKRTMPRHQGVQIANILIDEYGYGFTKT